MLLLDFDYRGVGSLKASLAHMLTSALLIAKSWKVQENLTMFEWVGKVKYMY